MTDWSIPPGLVTAYQQCRQVHRHHGRTYYLATTLLPKERRPHVWALYAFARTGDDLVDRPRADPHETLPAWCDAALATLRTPGTAGTAGTAETPRDGSPVLAAVSHTRRALGLDVGLFEDFLTSMLMDLSVTRYPTWEDLRGYMRGSAAAIGEMMAPLLGAGSAAVPRARALGEAFQFTNFVRDVAEDLARGRVYLPAEDLVAHDVGVADLARARLDRRPDVRVRALIAAEVARGLALYEEARPGLDLVDARSRACLETAFQLYREILLEVARRDHNVFAGRVQVSRPARAATVAAVLRRRGRPG